MGLLQDLKDIVFGKPDGLDAVEQEKPDLIKFNIKAEINPPEKPEPEPEKQQEYKRPQRLADFIGNSSIKGQLETMVRAVSKTNKRVPNILFFGHAGTGKTTLSKIVSNEANQPCLTITGNTVTNQSELMSIIFKLQDLKAQTGKPPILFIDEINSVTRAKDLDQTIWLPLIEDFVFYNNLEGKTIEHGGGLWRINTGEYNTPEFTIIGATTNIADLHPAMRRRFPLQFFMKPYTVEELQQILLQYAGKLNMPLPEEAALNIARRSRFTPATALSLLETCEYYQIGNDLPAINSDVVNKQMELAGVDKEGLKWEDTEVLKTLAEFPKGLGCKNLSGTAGIPQDILEEIVEPFLKAKKLMCVTNKRIITQAGLEYIQKGGC